jgi:hypothetical protein
VGPGIGPCCYEVSAEMADAWRRSGLPARGRRLDLWETNRWQLVRAGVPAGQVRVAGVCTCCMEDFFSYRRGESTGRNMAVLVL